MTKSYEGHMKVIRGEESDGIDASILRGLEEKESKKRNR